MPVRDLGTVFGTGILVAFAALSCGAVADDDVPGADAAAACATLRRVALPDAADGVRSLRLDGALELALAAGAGDARYRPLAEVVERAQDIRSQTLSAHSPRLTTALTGARDLCSQFDETPSEPDGEADASAGAATDARTACAALERTGAIDAADPAGLHRWSAARALAMAAATGDERYQPLADSLRTARAIHTRTFSVDSPELLAEMRKARDSCADLSKSAAEP